MDEKKWALEIAEKIFEKTKKVVERHPDSIPYTAQDGVFDDWSAEDKICWWTNGFFAGELWKLYHAFGWEDFKKAAERIEDKLDANLMNYMGMDHDSGFKWELSAVVDYKLTGNEKSKNRAMLAAGNLAGRLNLKSGLIRAWNDPGNGDTAGWAIIDCMMNLPLLYWASEETKDPRFRQIAESHADHAAKAFIREDGSVNHIVTFDPETGEVTGSLGGQGMQEGSSWTRGQSWALYGFTLSFIHTKKKDYLEVAEKVADRILSVLREDYIMPVDFMQPDDCEWEDSSAAAIMACGFLELEKYCGKDKSEKYHEAAIGLLKTLVEKRCRFEPEVDPLLEMGTVAYHCDEHNLPLIYGDYYFTEAILKLCGKDLVK